MSKFNRPAGMTGFAIVWIGQIISLLGTQMTGLGIPIWVYSQTESATDLTVIQGLFMAAMLIMSPFAGVLIDRSNRKLMMMLSDLASGLVTVAIFILYVTGQLEIWHLYITATIQGAFQSFQWPAFSSAISTMVPKEQYTRASTMLETAIAAGSLFGPVTAGALLSTLGGERGLMLILLIDIVSFVVAIGTLLFVHIPQPETTSAAAEAAKGTFLEEASFGLRYILQRPSLLGLQTIFLVSNLFFSVSFSLLSPMLLARTNSDELLFGTIQTIGAVGGVVGGIIISAWGGFKRRVVGIIVGYLFSVLGMVLIGLGRPEPAWAGLPIWAAGMFIDSFIVPLINGSNQAIWLSKVPPELQGRVFSIRRLIAGLVIPLGSFIAGPLADRVLEPAMQDGGALAEAFSWLVGTGPGAGMSLTFVFMATLVAIVSLSLYLLPIIRNVEDILPDYDGAGTNSQEGIGNA